MNDNGNNKFACKWDFEGNQEPVNAQPSSVGRLKFIKAASCEPTTAAPVRKTVYQSTAESKSDATEPLVSPPLLPQLPLYESVFSTN